MIVCLVLLLRLRVLFFVFFFFFKQKTAYEMRISDWSSDVCSSDLVPCLSTFLVLLQAVGSPEADVRDVCVRKHFGAAVLANIFRIVADQTVTLASDAVLDLAGRGAFVAFLHTALGLELGHFFFLSDMQSVVLGKSVLFRVYFGGRLFIK